MAAYNKFNLFTRDLSTGKHDFANHQFNYALTNSAPSASNAVFADITEIAAGNGYTAGGVAATLTESNASGTEKIAATGATITASGGSIGPFQYVVFYNTTQTSPLKPLISWFDYGSLVTLSSGQQFVITPDAANGLLQMA